VSSIVKSVGRSTAVEDVADAEGYDPVTEETKDQFTG
jgi:hypothetical protein